MKPEYDGLLRNITQWSRWEYKGKTYQVLTTTPGLLSQDAELDEWCPTVIYTVYNEHNDHETYLVTMDLRFARPITEFSRKFIKVWPKEKKVEPA